MKSIVLCLALVPCLALAREIKTDRVELPAGAISCQIDSPSRDECIKEAIQDMLPKLQKGIGYLNIPPIDPYTINDTTFDYKRNEISATLHLKTATFRGMSKAVIQAVRTKIDDEGMTTEIDVFAPRVYAEGVYKATGKFNNFKINSKGTFNATFKGSATTHKMEGKFQNIDGQRYLKIEHYDMIPSIDDMKIQMTGLFPDPELNKLAVEFVNQYWPFLYREIIPETKNIWEPLLVNEMNAFTLRLPFDEMLFYGDKKNSN